MKTIIMFWSQQNYSFYVKSLISTFFRFSDPCILWPHCDNWLYGDVRITKRVGTLQMENTSPFAPVATTHYANCNDVVRLLHGSYELRKIRPNMSYMPITRIQLLDGRKFQILHFGLHPRPLFVLRSEIFRNQNRVQNPFLQERFELYFRFDEFIGIDLGK